MQKRHLTEFNTSLIKTIIKLGVKGHFLTLNSIHENPIASIILGASQVALEVKNLSANAGDLINAGSIPGLGGSHGEGHSNPLQYSSLENPTDRGTWQANSPQGRRVGDSAHTQPASYFVEKD